MMGRLLDVLGVELDDDHAVARRVEGEATAGHLARHLPRVLARVPQVDREAHGARVALDLRAQDADALDLGDAVTGDRGGGADALQLGLGGEVAHRGE
jgi:hypothetical protein